MIFFCKAKKIVRDSRLRGNGILDIFTLRRLRGGVRARSGRGGGRVADDCRRSSTPQKFAGANFYPPPQAAEGETHSHSRESGESPCTLTVLERDAERQLEVREIPAFAGMGMLFLTQAKNISHHNLLWCETTTTTCLLSFCSLALEPKPQKST